METPDNQIENTIEEESTEETADAKPWLWKKGQSGNLKGRPKGKTMKEYVKDYLACMNEEERQEFLEGLPKEIIWKMAEGNPQNNVDLTTKGEAVISTISAEVLAEADRILKEKKLNANPTGN